MNKTVSLLMVLLFKEGAYILMIQSLGSQTQFFLYGSRSVLYLLDILWERNFEIIHKKKLR